MALGTIDTPLGLLIIEGSEKGLSSIKFSDDQKFTDQTVPEELQAAKEQIEAYFSGTLHSFNLKIDPEGTPFQHKVWKTVNQIPWGLQVSYLDLATTIGNPRAVRAVASALGRNPLLIIVPCHRIIGSNGAITGYAGGIKRKKWLLEHEQSHVQASMF